MSKPRAIAQGRPVPPEAAAVFEAAAALTEAARAASQAGLTVTFRMETVRRFGFPDFDEVTASVSRVERLFPDFPRR